MKKRQVLLALGLLIITAAQAQLEKGKRIVGVQTNIAEGDLYYSSLMLRVNKDYSDIGINIVPTLGWVVEKNWVIGGQVTLGWARDKYVSNWSNGVNVATARNNYYDLGIAPFTRYYIDITRNQKIKLFGMASMELAYGYYKTQIKNNNGTIIGTNSDNTINLDGSIGFGMAYFGKQGSLDLNLSNMGLRLGLYKVLPTNRKR